MSMKKNILVILITLLLTTALFAENEGIIIKPLVKKVDFSIGGLFSHTCNIALSISDRSMALMDEYYYESSVSFGANQTLAFLLPISIVFPYKKNISLGLSNNIGFALGLAGGFYPYPFFNGQTRFALLYGKNRKKQFISEYGIAYAIVLLGFQSYLGPSFYFGYQVKCKNNFMLTLGGNFEYLSGFNMDWYLTYYSMINIGFDIRFKFYKEF